ncbi:MAG: hypothetical protein NUV35_01450 [Syntrophomonadaceae bacterium]|nr:hypothetical protein [Syntrophomonadaceae bacterium]
MTRDAERWRRRLYEELATVIYEAHCLGRLSSREMLCLMELLEEAFTRREGWPLLQVLHRWAAAPRQGNAAQEIDAIVLATLAGTDLQDPAARAQATDIISSLVAALESPPSHPAP